MSRRTHLHDLTRDLRRYLAWQKARGVPGVVPATPEERAGFDARKKAVEERKMEERRAQIMGDTGPTTGQKPPERPSPSSRPAAEQPGAKKPAARAKKETPERKPSAAASGTTSASALWKRHDPMYQINEDRKKKAAKRRAPVKPKTEARSASKSPVKASAKDPATESSGMPEDIQFFEETMDFSDPRDDAYFQESEDPAPTRKRPPAKASKKPETPEEKMEFLKNYLGDCQRCPLHKGRTNIVFGDGDPRARLMFIGEGPGYHEDQKGIPFVGKSGQLLTKMIEAMGLSRETVYIANVVKCRPPENRDPQADEIRQCSPFLQKQIEVVQPEVIVTLGRFATTTLLGEDEALGKLRGRWHTHMDLAVMPTYHPAYLLRNDKMKGAAWSDLKMVMERLGDL